jgi:hypothetical protein
MRFGVGEFAGLVVGSSRPEFRATFRAEPSKAVTIAPFQEASPVEVAQNLGAIKAQVQAIVSGSAGLNQKPRQPVPATTLVPRQPIADEEEGLLLE